MLGRRVLRPLTGAETFDASRHGNRATDRQIRYRDAATDEIVPVEPEEVLKRKAACCDNLTPV